jgi:hypothetical protein
MPLEVPLTIPAPPLPPDIAEALRDDEPETANTGDPNLDQM